MGSRLPFSTYAHVRGALRIEKLSNASIITVGAGFANKQVNLLV